MRMLLILKVIKVMVKVIFDSVTHLESHKVICIVYELRCGNFVLPDS